jgi:hypothetical protein
MPSCVRRDGFGVDLLARGSVLAGISRRGAGPPARGDERLRYVGSSRGESRRRSRRPSVRRCSCSSSGSPVILRPIGPSFRRDEVAMGGEADGDVLEAVVRGEHSWPVPLAARSIANSIGPPTAVAARERGCVNRTTRREPSVRHDRNCGYLGAEDRPPAPILAHGPTGRDSASTGRPRTQVIRRLRQPVAGPRCVRRRRRCRAR